MSTDTAARWVTGRVMHGDGYGRNLGVPTANILLDSVEDHPHKGIYAAWAVLPPDNTVWPAALHVGPRPTFGKALQTIELHIIGMEDESLFDQRIAFMIHSYLREIETFDSVDALVTAMCTDIDRSKQVLVEQPEVAAETLEQMAIRPPRRRRYSE